jgi:hypothetical protein
MLNVQERLQCRDKQRPKWCEMRCIVGFTELWEALYKIVKVFKVCARPYKLTQAVKLLLCVRKMTASNLERGTCNCDCDFA